RPSPANKFRYPAGSLRGPACIAIYHFEKETRIMDAFSASLMADKRE
ncbi:hypothetical protein BBBGCB_BBBGCB_12285, partial [Dysosmobacter welbionis]